MKQHLNGKSLIQFIKVIVFELLLRSLIIAVLSYITAIILYRENVTVFLFTWLIGGWTGVSFVLEYGLLFVAMFFFPVAKILLWMRLLFAVIPLVIILSKNTEVPLNTFGFLIIYLCSLFICFRNDKNI